MRTIEKIVIVGGFLLGTAGLVAGELKDSYLLKGVSGLSLAISVGDGLRPLVKESDNDTYQQPQFHAYWILFLKWEILDI